MTAQDFSFERRLEYASTLPSEWYMEPALLEQEKERVFSRTWQLVGRAEQVAAPGDYFTASIGHEPVLVARGADERLRAFSNVCRHRAGPVASGEGKRKAFQCGYHGWAYALDGRLLTAPEFDGVECFGKDSVCLPQFKVESWNGLVFVNLDDDSESLEDVLEDLPQRIGGRDMSSMRLAARRDWYVDCNWKVYVDNYLEGYHIPIVHPSLNRELDYQKYRVETKRYYSIQHSPIKRVEGGRIGKGDGASDDEAQYFWIFPNLMLNIYPDNYSTNLIVPLGPTRTLTVFEWFFLDPDRPETKDALSKTLEFSDEIQLEDINI